MLCGMFSKLTIKTPERRQLTFDFLMTSLEIKVNWRRSCVFVVNFENIPHNIQQINLLFL